MYEDFKYYNPFATAMDEAHALLRQAAHAAMTAGTLPERELPDFVVEIPSDVKNGDLASNFAMTGARVFGMPPRKIAEILCAAMPSLAHCVFERVEIAGPGFINLFFAPSWFGSVVLAANVLGADYGRTNTGAGRKVNVEFVSANPTGPMHLGNARGGALGDCLAEALDWAGFCVTREFYINDAGNQIAKFGKSLAARYLQIFKGEDAIAFPEDGYQGEDIKVLAQAFADANGDAFVTQAEQVRHDALVAFALPQNIASLKQDLAKYRIDYDVWFHESELHTNGAVRDVLKRLSDMDATYEKDGAVWYRAARFSEKYGANKSARKGLDGQFTDEDKDEVLVRANGVPTYLAADIAYHYNKFVTRGFDTSINVWGADHHGHVARMKGAMDALGLDGGKLDIVLMQFVRLLQNGEPVRMSKRTGKAITLSTLLDEVPLDSARFLFNLREAGSTVDFDLDLAVKQDSDNPVYYVQYAHARICSILKKLMDEGIDLPDVVASYCVCSSAEPRQDKSVSLPAIGACDYSLLTHEAELALIRHIAAFPCEIVGVAKSYDPARLTRFAVELATQYHKFYNTCRVKDAEPALRAARLALCNATKITLHNVLTMLKVTVPESM